MSALRRIALPALLALMLGLAACGGDDTSESSSSGETTTEQQETQAPPETTAADPAADAEQEEETKALGTMQAFVTAAEENDEAVFCGITTKNFLNYLEKGLTVAQCVEGLKGVEFKALRRLRGAKADSVEVDDNVAAGTLILKNGNNIGIILKKPEDRWLVDDFSKR